MATPPSGPQTNVTRFRLTVNMSGTSRNSDPVLTVTALSVTVLPVAEEAGGLADDRVWRVAPGGQLEGGDEHERPPGPLHYPCRAMTVEEDVALVRDAAFG